VPGVGISGVESLVVIGIAKISVKSCPVIEIPLAEIGIRAGSLGALAEGGSKTYSKKDRNRRIFEYYFV